MLDYWAVHQNHGSLQENYREFASVGFQDPAGTVGDD